MPALRNASTIVGNPLRHDLDRALWPAESIRVGDHVSLRRVIDRFGGAGEALAALERGTAQAWPQLARASVVASLRARVSDPASLRQLDTPLCGPASLAFEFARRDPARYVSTIACIYAEGGFTATTGRRIAAEPQLRAGPVPSPNKAGERLSAADWLLLSTLRDDENAIFDVVGDEAKRGVAGLTLPSELAAWTRDVLGLRAGVISCVTAGEIAAIRAADAVVRARGLAFLLIDASLIKDGTGQSEEHIGYERIERSGGQPRRQSKRHSQDDGIANHWVVYLGGLELHPDANDDSKRPISLRVWSWGAEFLITGTAEAFSEYLYAVVTGSP